MGILDKLFGKKDISQYFKYELVDGNAIIRRFEGKRRYDCLEIPDTIDGYPVIGIESNDKYHYVFDTSYNYDNKFSFGKIVLPNSLKSIGRNAFSFTEIGSINIPNGVTSIGNEAFNNCKIKSIIIPDGVIEIGDKAFYSNRETEKIVMPTSIKRIGEEAFASCETRGELYYKGTQSEFLKIVGVASLIKAEKAHLEGINFYNENPTPEERKRKIAATGFLIGCWHYVDGVEKIFYN